MEPKLFTEAQLGERQRHASPCAPLVLIYVAFTCVCSCSYGGVYLVSALTTVTKRSPTPPFVLGQDPKGVLAGPGTPKVRFLGFVFAVCPIGTMYSPQKFDFRDLYSGFAPSGPCIATWIQPVSRPGCASWVRTPRDPKSHLFVTKWDAVAPFGTWGPGSYAEFRRGSRQIGPTPLNLDFFGAIF